MCTFLEKFIGIDYLTQTTPMYIPPVEKGRVADPVDISYNPIISLLRFSGYAHNSYDIRTVGL